MVLHHVMIRRWGRRSNAGGEVLPTLRYFADHGGQFGLGKRARK